MRKILLILFIFSIFGCATIPSTLLSYNYQTDVDKVWNEIKTNLPLKLTYTYKMCLDDDKDLATKGMAQILNYTVYLPEGFLRYIYTYYYDNRSSILTCVILHELAHIEFDLLYSAPPQAHYLIDKAVVENFIKLNKLPYTIDDYYSTLKVMSYWGANRHRLNNAVNFLTLIAVGYGNFIDEDFNIRLQMFSYDYPQAYFIFSKSK